jgi:biopolymer transport protein TolR
MGMAAGEAEGDIKSTPNVIPMIDIMLVLLIIFMIMAPVISGGFRATMPQARNLESRPEDDNDIILGIDLDGSYYLDNGSGETSRIVNDSLASYLTQVYQDRQKDKILYFRADQSLPYGYIEDAVEVAREAGVRVLAAITDQRREERGGR